MSFERRKAFPEPFFATPTPKLFAQIPGSSRITSRVIVRQREVIDVDKEASVKGVVVLAVSHAIAVKIA